MFVVLWIHCTEEKKLLKAMFANLLGLDERPIKVNVYHDESGNYHCDQWVCTGLLWVKEAYRHELHEVLRQARKRHNYWGEIHYCDLARSFNGEFGSKARVARDWLNLYINGFCDKVWFNVLAVNTRHKLYERNRFTKDFHAYNRFTAMTLYSGLIWHFKNCSKLQLQIFSDEKSRRPQGFVADGIDYDNFEQYIVRRLEYDLKRDDRLLELVFSVPPLITLSHTNAGSHPKDWELLQLSDLILGAVSGAIEKRSSRQTKRWLSDQISELILDTRRKPWEQAKGLHRRFSVSYFPNNREGVYCEGPVYRSMDEDQMCLF